MKTLRCWVVCGLLVLAGLHGAAQARTIDEVLACMQANVPDALSVRRIEIETRNASMGERQLQGRLYARREPLDQGARPLRLMLRIDQPAELSGAAYLIREAQRYEQEGLFVYLPSVRRVRRVTGSFADASLLGTDFSYEEFKRLQGVFGETRPTRVASAQIDGREVDVLELHNEQAEGDAYDVARIAVDRQTCVPLRLEFFSGATLRKLITSPAESLTASDGHWYAAQIEAHDPVAGSRTLLRLRTAASVDEVPDRYFNPLRFYALD